MATISNFGVPTGSGGRARILQPKSKFKWRVRLFGFGPTVTPLDITAQVQSIGRPNGSMEKVAVHTYNSVMYYAGKHAWNSIDMTVRDDVTNAVATLVGHQYQKQQNHFTQVSPIAGSNYKFDMVIETMDGNDAVLETFTLENCWLESVNYGEFDYTDTGGFMTIQMSIVFDNATQEDGIMPLVPEIKAGVFV